MPSEGHRAGRRELCRVHPVKEALAVFCCVAGGEEDALGLCMALLASRRACTDSVSSYVVHVYLHVPTVWAERSRRKLRIVSDDPRSTLRFAPGTPLRMLGRCFGILQHKLAAS